jgi:hypothetical protein
MPKSLAIGRYGDYILCERGPNIFWVLKWNVIHVTLLAP